MRQSAAIPGDPYGDLSSGALRVRMSGLIIERDHVQAAPDMQVGRDECLSVITGDLRDVQAALQLRARQTS